MHWSLFIIIPFALIIIVLVGSYNQLIKFKNNRLTAFSDVDVQLNQRHDLIPQLLETVKGYMKHESNVLNQVTQARTAALNAQTLRDKVSAENKLSNALGSFRVVVEAYPEIMANTNFIILQNEIADIENKLSATRRYFNSSTKEYNNAVETFPSNIIALIFGFKKEVMFEIKNTVKKDMEQAPTISF